MLLMFAHYAHKKVVTLAGMHGPVHDVVFRLLKLTMDVRRTEVTAVLCCEDFFWVSISCVALFSSLLCF